MSNTIHWYPGHMKRAQIEIENKLKVVDAVIELLDARIPLSSRNEILYKITENKKRLVVLTKNDLADDIETTKWIKYFKNVGFDAIFADLNNEADIKKIIKIAESLGENKWEKEIKRGMKPQPIRAMVIGIPNVGKSTFINKVAKRHAASVQNKPGHTKSQQWIKVSNKFELLDTPGILPTSYHDEIKAINLALVGSINENILPDEELCNYVYKFLYEKYSENLFARFSYLKGITEINKAFELIAQKRGYFSKGKEDIDKAYKVFLNELKNGNVGKITFEQCR